MVLAVLGKPPMVALETAAMGFHRLLLVRQQLVRVAEVVVRPVRTLMVLAEAAAVVTVQTLEWDQTELQILVRAEEADNLHRQ